MKLEEFYRECELRLKPEVARSVPKAVLAFNKCLRGLVSRLPYLQKENAGQLKQTKLLHYVDDVLKVRQGYIIIYHAPFRFTKMCVF